MITWERAPPPRVDCQGGDFLIPGQLRTTTSVGSSILSKCKYGTVWHLRITVRLNALVTISAAALLFQN